jgi:chemosensory pili system protein ChpA (sensor histidine kinase/response regulator)
MSGQPAGDRRDSAAVVLLADDHEATADGYARLLTTAGFQVIRAKDGYEALGQVSRQVPSLVILDLKLSKMDGWELLQHVKGNAATAHMPVVVITDDTLPSHHELARSRGAAVVLTKPIQPNDLLDAVRRALSQP